MLIDKLKQRLKVAKNEKEQKELLQMIAFFDPTNDIQFNCSKCEQTIQHADLNFYICPCRTYKGGKELGKLYRDYWEQKREKERKRVWKKESFWEIMTRI